MIDNPRVDLMISRYGRTLAIAALAVGLLALVATGWVVANPGTSTTTQQTGTETIETDVRTSAVVVQDGLWPEGTVLEGSPVYPLNDTPEVTLEPETTVPNDRSIVSHVVTVRFEATAGEEAFWTETDEVLNESVPVEDGVAASAVTVDVASLAERRAELEETVGGMGTVDLSVDLEVAYDTGSNAGTKAASTPLAFGSDAYWFAESLAVDEDHPEYRDVEVTESPSAALVGALALVATAAFGVAALVVIRSPVDPAAARRAVHERRYAEWISHGTIPMWIGDHHIALDTLEDVVDVAIDTNERVVHDRQRGLFAVVNDNVVYYYSDRGVWEETAWPDIDLDAQSSMPDLDGDVEPPGPADVDSTSAAAGECDGDAGSPDDAADRTGGWRQP